MEGADSPVIIPEGNSFTEAQRALFQRSMTLKKNVSRQNHPATSHSSRVRKPGSSSTTVPETTPLQAPVDDASTLVPVAPWRVKIHEARRRAIRVVLTSIWLRAGLKHPRRLRRVDSFSYYIPALLQVGYGRFRGWSQGVGWADAVCMLNSHGMLGCRAWCCSI